MQPESQDLNELKELQRRYERDRSRYEQTRIARDAELARLKKNGVSLRMLADELGVGRARVQQILRRQNP